MIELQPKGLHFDEDDDGNQWYVCSECSPGYYWDDNERICKTCGIENCHICTSIFECRECVDGYFLQYDGETCEQINEYCTIPVEAYNTTSNDESSYFYCDQCWEDAYFDDATKSCQSCTIIPNCLECSDATNCQKCGSNWHLNEDNYCSSPDIPNCEVVNSENGDICDKCLPFYGLSEDRESCIACDTFSQGCKNC